MHRRVVGQRLTDTEPAASGRLVRAVRPRAPSSRALGRRRERALRTPSTSPGGGISRRHRKLVLVAVSGTWNELVIRKVLLALHLARHLPGAEGPSVAQALDRVRGAGPRTGGAQEVPVEGMDLEPVLERSAWPRSAPGPPPCRRRRDHRTHHSGLVVVKVGLPFGIAAGLPGRDGIDQLGHGGRDHLGFFGLVKLHGRPRHRMSRQVDFDCEALLGQVHARGCPRRSGAPGR